MAPASLLLVHGAGSGPWIYSEWLESFPGVRVVAIDLQEGLDLADASMRDYAGIVVAAARSVPQPVALCGWSMGGLVALLACERSLPQAVVLIEPSPPGEVQGFDDSVRPSGGTFDPEVAYGAFPAGVRARPESALARAERKQGISVPTVPCPSLVVYGDEFRHERGVPVARLYGSVERSFAGLDHWGLIRDARVRAAVAEFLGVSDSYGQT